MLEYYRFHADLPQLAAAKPVYVKREAGSGWPEHCPPIRAASGFGWDVINPFTMRFVRNSGGAWSIEESVSVESDVDVGEGVSPHAQVNAWFWEKGQQRPHVITDNVYAQIRHQCKVSTYLYLRTEVGWMLWMTSIPNLKRDWSVIESVIETDWYFPAHPWHTVIELPRVEASPIDEVLIEAGAPLCRLVPVQRAEYSAFEMDNASFGELFDESQSWLAAHGKDPQGDDVDITGQYARQQDPATFDVRTASSPNE